MQSPSQALRPWRFRFGIRTLLVVIAAVALFCGYHMHWIHQRHEFLALQGDRENQLEIVRNTAPQNGQLFGIVTYWHDQDRMQPKSSPIFLWLFGDESHESVRLVFHVTPSRHPDPDRPTRQLPDEVVVLVGQWDEDQVPKEEVARARQLFPEAEIHYCLYGTEPK